MVDSDWLNGNVGPVCPGGEVGWGGVRVLMPCFGVLVFFRDVFFKACFFFFVLV